MDFRRWQHWTRHQCVGSNTLVPFLLVYVLTSRRYADGGIVREGVQGESAAGDYSTGVSLTCSSPL